MKTITLIILLNVTCIISVSSQTTPNYLPTKGLVAWWPFNGNTDDESMNGNYAINHGCKLTTDRFGVQNKAYSFDGIYSHIEVEMQNNTLQLKNNFTISVWANLKFNLNNSQVIFSKGDKSSNEYSLVCSNEQDLYINKENFDTNNLISFSNHFNKWTNIVCVFKNGFVLVYINGKFVATNLITDAILPSSLSLVFGAVFKIGTNTPVKNSYLTGDLDDIGIWDEALSAEEINKIYLSAE